MRIRQYQVDAAITVIEAEITFQAGDPSPQGGSAPASVL